MILNSLKPAIWGTILVALSGILYGLLGYFGTHVLDDHISVTNMLFWRFLIAFGWMLIYSFINAREKISLNRSNFFILFLTFLFGSLFYSGSSAFYFLASEYTGTGLAMVIFFCFPVFVAIFAWTTKKEKINAIALSSLCFILTGLFLLKGKGETSLSFIGIIFAVTAALSYAFYLIGSQYSAGKIHPSLLTTLLCLGNTLIFFLFAYFTDTLTIPTSWNIWFHLLALGIFATAIPIQLLLSGLKYISPLKASVLSVLEPVVTLLMGTVLLDESLTGLQFIGVAILLLGGLLIQFDRQQIKPK